MGTDFSRLARRFVVERHRRCRGALPFLCSHELTQFFGIANDRSRMRMFGRPLARVLAESMDVVARFAREFVLHPPDFFKNWIGFHRGNSPTQSGRNSTRFANSSGVPT